jgi:hypothetical protein
MRALLVPPGPEAPAPAPAWTGPPDLLAWLRRGVDDNLYDPGFEATLRQLTGPNLTGRGPAPTPDFLAGVDIAGLRPEQVAPFLSWLSMTRPRPQPGSWPAWLAAQPVGQASSAPRSADQRRWGQPPDSGAPLLPSQTAIPRVVHAIWLGGPLTDPQLMANLAAGAQRYAGQVHFVLWTDVPRARLDAAQATPPPPGQPDPLAAERAMLAWAQRHGISLVNVDEVFHAGNPMTGFLSYVVAMAKQLPRGYAGASDLLRMAILHLLGGGYIDLDNRYVDANGQPLPKSLVTLFDEVAASGYGFTLNRRPDGRAFNDIIIAPAGHPFLRYLMERTRVNYGLDQVALYGGYPQMTRRFVGTPLLERRHSVTWRAAPRSRPQLAVDVSLLTHPSQAIDHASARSWHDGAQPAGPSTVTFTSPAPPTEDEIAARLLLAAQELGRELGNREGNLYWTGVASVIAALPDPGAAWIAVLDFLVEDLGWAPRASSQTRHRIQDDGADFYVDLPPEAEQMLGPGVPGATWFGSATSTDGGRSATLLDETVTPATLRRRRPQPSLPPTAPVMSAAQSLQGLYEVLTDANGRQHLWLRTPQQAADPAKRAAATQMAVPDGYVGIQVQGRQGEMWVGDRRIRPAEAALLLAELGLAGRPVFLAMTGGGQAGPRSAAARLATLLLQPVRATPAQVWISHFDGVVASAITVFGPGGVPGLLPVVFVEFLPFSNGVITASHGTHVFASVHPANANLSTNPGPWTMTAA